MSEKLKPCPCGSTPSQLIIVDSGQGGKWALVYGECCAEWQVEFRTMYNDVDSEKCKEYAIEAWNDAPRSK